MTKYAIWKPERDGHAPPNWRKGMAWAVDRTPCEQPREPRWIACVSYWLPPEALNSPNDDARQEALKELTRLGQEADALEAISLVRKLPADFLAKHGITLSEPKDWATELWADVLEAWDMHETAELVRRGAHGAAFVGPINLLRTRFEQMKGEG